MTPLQPRGPVPSVKPYYEDEYACACGCGKHAAAGRRFLSGHNLRALTTRSEKHRAGLAEGQRRAWATTRTDRKPLGSTRLDANGYRLVKTRHGQARWEKEHILVVEQSIGRRLVAGEEVHHINGQRADNRLENLCLFSSGAAHQRAEGSMKRVVRDLLDQGRVVFDRERGEYRLV